MAHRAMGRARLGGLLLAALVVVGGCSSDDDDGNVDAPTDMDGNGNGDGMDGVDGDGSATASSLLDIAARDADSDPVTLDGAALDAEIATLLGDGDSAAPLAIEDGDDAASVLRRRQGGAGL